MHGNWQHPAWSQRISTAIFSSGSETATLLIIGLVLWVWMGLETFMGLLFTMAHRKPANLNSTYSMITTDT